MLLFSHLVCMQKLYRQAILKRSEIKTVLRMRTYDCTVEVYDVLKWNIRLHTVLCHFGTDLLFSIELTTICFVIAVQRLFYFEHSELLLTRLW